MHRAGTIAIVAGKVALGVVVVATRYSVPEVRLELDGGVFVWSLVGAVLSLLTAVYLFWRWHATGRANPLAFVWALSFCGLFAMMVGYLLSSLGGIDAASAKTAFGLKIGFLFWCYGFLAGSLYVFYPEQSRFWVVVPSVVFGVAVVAAGYMCCVLRESALLEKAVALLLATPVLAVTAHSFGYYLRLRRATFARLLYSGFAVAVAAQIMSAFFHGQPLQYLGMALFDISLALFLCGFIFMRFETQEEAEHDLQGED